MNPRATGILLLCAAALGAFVWFYEIEGEADRKAGEEAEKRLFSGFDAESIDWVELAAGDGPRVRAQRGEYGWEIVAPITFPGDATAWDGVASTLALVTSETSFDDPQPAAVYGLGESADEIRFGVGSDEHALRLGGSAPMGGNVYAAVVGAGPVHTIASWRATSLRKDSDALRDKSVLDFEVGTVAKFEAEWPGVALTLERDGNAWRMTSPIEGPADTEAVNDLLSDLAFMRADGFNDGPVSDAEVGLDPPAYRATLSLAPYSEESGLAGTPPPVLEIAVGDAIDDGSIHVRSAPASLYRVAAARLDDLPRNLSAYRYKQLADFDAASANRIELVMRGDDGAAVEIVATRGDEGWSSAPEALDPEKLAALVRELSGLTADQILAERVGPEELAGLELLDPPASFTVRAAEGEEPLAQVRLGAQQGSEGILAQSGENPQIFRLALELAEQLPVSLEALRNHFLESDEPEEIDPPADASAGPNVDFDPEALKALLEGAGDGS